MNFLLWIILGGLSGWIATLIYSEDGKFGIVGNVVVGIIGAIVGGYISRAVFGGPTVTGLNVESFIVAVVGAILVLFIVNLVSRRI